MGKRLADEANIDGALDRYARKTTMRRLTKQVLATQRELQRVTSYRAWRAYLAVEAAVNARDFELIDAAIRIALRLRKKHSRTKPRAR